MAGRATAPKLHNFNINTIGDLVDYNSGLSLMCGGIGEDDYPLMSAML